MLSTNNKSLLPGTRLITFIHISGISRHLSKLVEIYYL